MDTTDPTAPLMMALEAAKSRKGFTAPNPAVGAVLVTDGRIRAIGTHWACGAPHAEVDVLKKVNGSLKDTTLYVTLEPCCHYGRTPPCVDAIIQRGIKQVIFSEFDPNPKVSGQGMQRLREASVDCRRIALPEIQLFYRSYLHWVRHQAPWVTMKLAITSDGKFAEQDGSALCITGASAHAFTHEKRLESDAILTTVQTVISDDPKMNVRIGTQVFPKPIYVLDRYLRFPVQSTLVNTAQRITLYYEGGASAARLKRLEDLGLRCVSVDAEIFGLDLRSVLKDIGQQGIHDLWVEVGARCFESFYVNQLAQRIYVLRSKRNAPHAKPAFSENFNPLKKVDLIWHSLGEDAYTELKLG